MNRFGKIAENFLLPVAIVVLGACGLAIAVSFAAVAVRIGFY